MQDRKLTRILRKMLPEERLEFAEYLRSPLHSRRPKLAEMVQKMEAMLFSEPAGSVSHVEFYHAVYPGKRYDANDLNRSVSVILRELKGYFALLQYRKDRAAQYVYTLREYADRRWADLTAAGIREVRKRLDSEIEEGEDYYYQHYQVGKVEGQYWVENMPKNPGLIYQNALDRVDEFFALAKTKYMVLAINHDLIHDTEHQPRFTKMIAEDIPTSNISGLLIRLFNQIYQCRANPESEELILAYIDTLKTEIPYYDPEEKQIDEGPLISKDDAELLYGMGFNRAVEFRHLRGNSWVPTINDLLREAIEKGVFLIKGKLYDGLYTNQIKLLSVTGYTELAYQFFEDYKNRLQSNPNNTTVMYNEGFISYLAKDYRFALKCFLKFKNYYGEYYSSAVDNDVRMMRCVSWYQTGEIDQMIHEINAFRAYLRRSKTIPQERINSYKAFCSLMLRFEKIIHGRPEKISAKLVELKETLQQKRVNGKTLILAIIKDLQGQ
ncbi:MAG: hypothetical protein AAGN35_18795 [Bacteroidota bacterium]